MNRIRLLLAWTVLALTGFQAAQAAGESTGDVPYGANPQAGRHASVNGIEMYFETYGSGQPLLLIHGNGQNIAAMHFQIAFFAEHYQVIVADSRGHGKSSLGAGRLTYEQMMEDYNALLEELGVAGARIVGWSDGGILGLLLAIHHPDKVAALAVMGANLRPDDTAVHSWTQDLLQPLSRTVDEMIATNDDSGDWALSRQLLDLLMTQPDIPAASLRRIEAPVLVIAGDRDIIRNVHTVEIFENLERAHLAILPGQTHWAPVSDPNGFNALVERFFDTPFTRPESRELLARELHPPQNGGD